MVPGDTDAQATGDMTSASVADRFEALRAEVLADVAGRTALPEPAARELAGVS